MKVVCEINIQVGWMPTTIPNTIDILAQQQ